MKIMSRTIDVAIFFLSLFHLYNCAHIISDRAEIKSKAKTKRGASRVEVITPVRLHPDLSGPTDGKVFLDRTSLLDQSRDFLNSEFQNPVFNISAFGQQLVIRLTPDEDLVSPSYTTAYTFRNRTSDESEILKQAMLRNCYYKGVVLGFPESQVALSVCNSLTGSVYTDQFHFFIEPAIESHSEVSDDSLPHLIHRTRMEDEDMSVDKGECGVNDKKHTRQYQETFKQHGKGDRHSEESKSRTKRDFASHQHYIETMIVADASFAAEHGDDLEHYILTLMAVANRVFSHPSLGSAISISVVKIMVIEDPADGPRVSSNAPYTLNEFCQWQKQYNTPDDSDPEHYDLAILMTKKDLCGDSCDTLGLAEVGAMCLARRSCAVVEDDGLSAAFTIAHEVGHVLNMMHDDNPLCRQNFNFPEGSSYIMSQTMHRIDSNQPWSECSREAVIDFLQDNRGECLRDRPQQQKVYPSGLPGEVYGVDEQCAMAFGRGAVECPYLRECGRLWCRIPSSSRPNQCHTKSFPRADGTYCARGMICLQGQCVAEQAPPQSVDGNWGAWSAYGSCSRSCDGGIQMSSRRCDHPKPTNGGNFCIGSRYQFRSCNTASCPVKRGESKPDFRAEQCSQYNGQQFPRLGVRVRSTWVPKYADVHPSDRCRLVCQSVETGSYITLADRVIDGTRCEPGSSDICVQGQCMPAGCDGVLGSKAKYSKCGVCNGDNSECKKVRGKFNKVTHGYSDILKLPAGAASIKIVQRSIGGSKNDSTLDNIYLALKTRKGDYILNGNYKLYTVKKDIDVNGTVIQYSGVSAATERIQSLMPIKDDLIVQVLSLTDSVSPRIRYSYYLPRQMRRARVKSKQIRDPRYHENMINKPTNNRRSKHERTTPAPVIPDGDKPRWVSGRWRKCKATDVYRKCGSGWKNRSVTCKRGKYDSYGCDMQTRPYARIPCYIHECPTMQPPKRTDPPTNQYNKTDRPFWYMGPWGACSTSCGPGYKQRHVKCQTRSGRLLDDTMCAIDRRPTQFHTCQLRPCR